MPDRIIIDIGETEIGTNLRVADLVAPEGTKILDDPDTVIVSVAAPRVEVEEAPEEELAEGEEPAEGEEAPEGEAPAAEAAGEEAPSGDEGEPDASEG